MKRLGWFVLCAGSLVVALWSRVALAEEHLILAQPNLTFEPNELTIVAGDTVTWTNNGGLHNVRADNDAFRCANGCDGQGGNGDPSTANWSFSLVFSDAETISYHCEIHGVPGGVGMSGVVEVISTPIFSDDFESGDTSAWSQTVP